MASTKAALITGGATGIGRSAALALATGSLAGTSLDVGTAIMMMIGIGAVTLMFAAATPMRSVSRLRGARDCSWSCVTNRVGMPYWYVIGREAPTPTEVLLDAPAIAGLPQLSAAIVDRLKQYEFGLRRDVLGADRERLFLSGTDEVPEAYRRLVEEYYRSLSRQRQ